MAEIDVFLTHKTKNKDKIKKISRFWLETGKIRVQFEDKYYKNGKNAQNRKIYDNFFTSAQTFAKIIINFSNFNFSSLIIFIKLAANFSSLAEIEVFFRFYSFFGFNSLKI